MQIKGKLFDLKQPVIMGIINITPDSFYANSRVQATKDILKLAQKHLKEGADWLDLGAFSSRPGAEPVSEETELERIIPAVETILDKFPKTIISVDTYRSKIASEAIKHGAAIINDITGGKGDSTLHKTVADSGCPYICMHSRGNPKNMQELTQYNQISSEVIKELSDCVNKAKKAGICDIIIDPGFGFAKTTEQNFRILRELKNFSLFNLPIMVGLSRKSMIYKSLNISPENAITGTCALNLFSLEHGANILRVHDVKEAVEMRQLYLMLKNS